MDRSIIFNTITTTLAELESNQIVEVCRFVSFKPAESFGPHIHRRIEINYVKRGSCQMKIGNEVINFGEGELVIVFSNVIHSFVALNKGCTLMQLEFLPDIFSEYEQLVTGGQNNQSTGRNMTSKSNFLKLVNNREITTSVEAIMTEHTSDLPNGRLMEIMYYGVLLIYIYRRLNEMFIVDCKSETLHKIVEYVKNNYEEQITVTHLATIFDISERNMRRLFNKYVGMSPNQFVNKVKIDKAIELLSKCQPNYSIKEVCYLCGFATPQYFSKIFKQVVGITPSDYLTQYPKLPNYEI